jgi:hypothetical protein
MARLPHALRRAPRARAALLLALLAGCGYRFATTGGALPGGARSLYVPLFKNLSPEPGVDAWFTEALREELDRAGQGGGEASDAVALGEVIEVLDGPSIAVTTKAIEAARLAGVRVVATLPRGGRRPEEIDLRGPVAFVFGGEGYGLASDVVEAADERVTIPMQAPVESLNVAVAAALLVYEAARQRHGARG